MTITLFVERAILENFKDFIDEIEFESNARIIRHCWHLDRNAIGSSPLVEVTVSYNQYVCLADNEDC